MNGGRPAFERHAVTIMVTLITGLLGWIALTTHRTAVGVAELQAKLEGITINAARLDRLEARVEFLERE